MAHQDHTKPHSEDQDDLDRYLDEYRKTLSTVAAMAVKYPERMDELRTMLKMSAALLITNRPGLVEDYRDAVADVDEFLARCQRGEIDPQSFITEEEDQQRL